MNKKKLEPIEEIQTLRVIAPDIYQIITSELEKQNIHSYDVQINAIKKEQGLQIILLFGENFTHKKEQFFTHEAIKNFSDEIIAFAKETGESCKEVMISEYFKMMRP